MYLCIRRSVGKHVSTHHTVAAAKQKEGARRVMRKEKKPSHPERPIREVDMCAHTRTNKHTHTTRTQCRSAGYGWISAFGLINLSSLRAELGVLARIVSGMTTVDPTDRRTRRCGRWGLCRNEDTFCKPSRSLLLRPTVTET